MPSLAHPLDAAKTSCLRSEAHWRRASDAFESDNGFYPHSADGLKDLLRQSVGATNWHGPYIDSIPKDSWGQEYRYECPGKHTSAGYPYDLWSLGGWPGKRAIANYDFGMKPL